MRLTLCGSTRFEDTFREWNHKLSLAGHSVYSMTVFGREESDEGKDGRPVHTGDEKVILDLVYLDKILNSDAIVVMNVGGYVGFSTRREIRWAKMQGKLVYWLEVPDVSLEPTQWEDPTRPFKMMVRELL